MENKQEEYYKLTDDIAKILIQYHKYILDRIDFESQYKDVMEKGKPYERPTTLLDDDTYVKMIYRNSPMFNNIVSTIVGYIMSEKEK